MSKNIRGNTTANLIVKQIDFKNVTGETFTATSQMTSVNASFTGLTTVNNLTISGTFSLTGTLEIPNIKLTAMGAASSSSDLPIIFKDTPNNQLVIDGDFTYNANSHRLTVLNLKADAIQYKTGAVYVDLDTKISDMVQDIADNASSITTNENSIQNNTTAITTNTNNIATKVTKTGNETIAGTKTFSSAIVGNLTGDVTGDLTGSVASGSNLSASPPTPVNTSVELATMRMFNHQSSSNPTYVYGGFKATGFNVDENGTAHVEDLSKIGYNMALWNDGHIRFQYNNYVRFYGTTNPSSSGDATTQQVQIGVGSSYFGKPGSNSDNDGTAHILRVYGDVRIGETAGVHGANYTNERELRVNGDITSTKSITLQGVGIDGSSTDNPICIFNSNGKIIKSDFISGNSGDRRLTWSEAHGQFTVSGKTVSTDLNVTNNLEMARKVVAGNAEFDVLFLNNNSPPKVKCADSAGTVKFKINPHSGTLTINNLIATNNGEITYKGQTLDARFGSGSVTAESKNDSTAYPVSFQDTTNNKVCIDSSPSNFTFNPNSNVLNVRNVEAVVRLSAGDFISGTSGDRRLYYNDANQTFKAPKGVFYTSLEVTNNGEITYKGQTLDARFGGGSLVNGYTQIFSDTKWKTDYTIGNTTPTRYHFGDDGSQLTTRPILVWYNDTTVSAPRYFQKGQNITGGAWDFDVTDGKLSIQNNDYAGNWHIYVSAVFENQSHSNGNYRAAPSFKVYKGNSQVLSTSIGPQYARYWGPRMCTIVVSGVITAASTSDEFTLRTYLTVDNGNKDAGQMPTTSDANAFWSGHDIRIELRYLNDDTNNSETTLT